MTAGNYYLRAGMYYFTGERFVHPGSEKREIGRKAIELPARRPPAALSEHRARRGAVRRQHRCPRCS